MKFKFLASLLCLLFWQNTSFAQVERILNYETQIEVESSRAIVVTEFIEVYVAGNVIKRGITRNLPTKRYLKDRLVTLKYDILEVEKNGVTEPYRIESSGDLMLYMGSKDVFLTPGIYKYKIKYRVPNQVAFYDDFDEIYWNAIGHDSQFNIEKASTSIRLPEGAKLIQESAYLGYQGQQVQKEQEYTFSEERGVLFYDLTRSLKPNEGFTIGIGFEKGVVSEPGIFDRYGTLIVIILGLLFLLPYYVSTWWRFGQDPATPPSYPLWDSPDGLSAASINYIQKGKYQSKSFTASVIDLAIKGYLRIEEVEEKGFFSNSKYFTLVRLKKGDSALPKEEEVLHEMLFLHNDKVSIEGKYDPKIEHAYDMHSASLSAQYSAFIWKGNNARLLWVPILVTIAVGVIAVLLLVNSSYAAGINLKVLIAFAPVAIIGLLLYIYLIRKPTIEKLDLRARIKGFLMYLEMTEKDRLNLLNPPDMTPEHFEYILPFAFALGVEHKWSEKFKNILEAAQYKPEWNNSMNTIYFSNHFGRNFTQNLSSATTQPSKTGSGGGSGGGGFSGGGGGGGGVGGW